jgi:hypothetical protein
VVRAPGWRLAETVSFSGSKTPLTLQTLSFVRLSFKMGTLTRCAGNALPSPLSLAWTLTMPSFLGNAPNTLVQREGVSVTAQPKKQLPFAWHARAVTFTVEPSTAVAVPPPKDTVLVCSLHMKGGRI